MSTRSNRRTPLRIASLLAVAALAVAACGSDGGDRSSRPRGGQADGGWIGGEPAWRSGGASGTDADVLAEAGEATAGAAPSEVGGDVERAGGPLRAGSVDDTADLPGYLDYLARLADAGIELRDVDPTGRVVVTVVGSDERPVPGAEVVVAQGGEERGRVRTTADGIARVLPAFLGASPTEPVELAVEGEAVTAEPGTEVTVALDRPGGVAGSVPVDILFLLDATGSMGDEIDRLKTTIDTVAQRVAALDAQPDLRFAMTLYRDEGDSFVTATHDFTGDVDAFRAALAEVEADGGGDMPEAFDEGLAAALGEPAWRDPAETVQLVFLVADAPPHLDRQAEQAYPASIRAAAARGIKVIPIASSSSDDAAEGVFRQVAQATGARFVFLSYGAEGAATGTHTDIDRTDYEELALDDLVVRLVTEELDALGGGGGTTTSTQPGTTTTTAPTTTTTPPGQ